ncbi:MAG: hypothetical protein WA584_01285 [Pyrinomonadaceae bacterium]
MKNKIDSTNKGECEATPLGCHGGVFTDNEGNPLPICRNGPGECFPAHIHEVDSSHFHDQQLINATKKIKKILADIPADSSGRKLTFFGTSQGLLLIWVNHGLAIPPDATVITKQENGEAAFAKALKIKDYKE